MEQSQILLLVITPVLGYLLYVLLKKSFDDDEESVPPRNKSKKSGSPASPSRTASTASLRVEEVAKQNLIEVNVPRRHVGAVIGAQGANIKEIQRATGARLNFKDDVSPEASERVLIIRGSTQSTQQAEYEVKAIISSQPEVVSEQILIPDRAVGRIIGRNGDTIRHLSHVSHAKILISKSEDRRKDGKRNVELVGTAESIAIAKSLIEEKLREEEVMMARQAVLTSHRQRKQRQPTHTRTRTQSPTHTHTPTSTHTSQSPPRPVVYTQEHGESNQGASRVESEDYLQVYISAVENVSHFWVQNLGAQAQQLDKLIEEMTKLYPLQQNNPQDTYEIGNIIAAPFPHDKSWYRARIEGLNETDQTYDLYYVDFGDSADVEMSTVRPLRTEFLSLPFQAYECFLADVEPVGDSWTDEAIEVFEELSYSAQWKVIMARTVNYSQSESKAIPCVQLIDTNGEKDVNIARALVDRGHAKWVKPPESQSMEGGLETIQAAQEVSPS